MLQVKYPWDALLDNNSQNIVPKDGVDVTWCPQVVVNEEHSIINTMTGLEYPSKTYSISKKIYNLPGPSIKGDTAKRIVLSINDEQVFFNYFDKNRSLDQYQLEQFEFFFDRIMNSLLTFFRESLKVDVFQKENIYWGQIIDEMHAIKDDDPAKYSLVVDLSRPLELINPIDRITEKPKKVLQRIHDQERIQKVKEVDIKCIIDLARRPGTVLSEKAGSKQRILAIKRKEKINILENRVTKHCCDLAVIGAKRYIREHEDIPTNISARKRSVLNLLKKSKSLPLKSTFKEVDNLIEPCRMPNYTLMQNPDYYKVWKAYLQLVKNEDLRSELWRWNRNMWVDFIALYLADLLNKYKIENNEIVEMGEKTVFGLQKHEYGTRLSFDSLPGPFIFYSGESELTTIYLINGDRETLNNFSKDIVGLSALNADYLLIKINKNNRSVLPIYGILPPYHLGKNLLDKFVNKMQSSLISTVENARTKFPKWDYNNSWILLGNWGQHSVNFKVSSLGKKFKCWTNTISPDHRFWHEDHEQALEVLDNYLEN